MNTISILLLDESSGDSLGLSTLSKQDQLSVFRVSRREEALEHLENEQYDLFLVVFESLKNKESLIQELVDAAVDTPIIVSSHNPKIAEVASIMRAGAGDYLEAPISPEALKVSYGKLVSRPGDGLRLPSSSRTKKKDLGFARIIGKSRKMKQVFSLIEKVCNADTTVLVFGESGTGKELIAQALHYEGARCDGPFVPVNCGAIPGELLESELFGHEKGAFTHAIRTRTGRFEMAHGGTVFLDEISEMSPMLQVKILRVLQERQFERIGGTKTIKSDFRVIAATNRNLEEEVNASRFRKDLYYRLNVIPIEAPPLRDRASDIPLLVDFFMIKYKRHQRKELHEITPEALDYLLKYSWPGNVRELENMVERMVILSTGDRISVDDLPERLLEAGGRSSHNIEEIPLEGFSLSQSVADFEKRLITQALDQAGWVKNRAAKLLNVNRTTLLEKMKRHELFNP
ncbi:MAG: sigma-54 dependent transcriptional regulator [Proteobacteria bacterium]|nr:sigma-54 dependent transcriptional regulator [Pseudomonadota bacterium]MBU1710545.1 sigma-54 dependent transcriptional regulator [Pseudomonadota bacterium]